MFCEEKCLECSDNFFFLSQPLAKEDLCPCPDTKDFYSATVTSDTLVNVTVSQQLNEPVSTGLWYAATVSVVYKGLLKAGQEIKVKLRNDLQCAVGALVVGYEYVLVGDYIHLDKHIEPFLDISRCGNFTLASLMDVEAQQFLNNYYNWATASCAVGKPAVCAEVCFCLFSLSFFSSLYRSRASLRSSA